MSQLEGFGINEMFWSGTLISIISSYLAEEDESAELESLRPYIYSSNLSANSRKRKHLAKQEAYIVSPNKAVYRTSQTCDLNKNTLIEMTKVIDNFGLWQDPSLIDFKIDRHVVQLQNKFIW